MDADTNVSTYVICVRHFLLVSLQRSFLVISREGTFASGYRGLKIRTMVPMLSLSVGAAAASREIWRIEKIA